jgi:hypothetical protein
MIIGYGDCIEPGCYRIHSCFGNAINFIQGKLFVSLVNMKVGFGPFHIVLSRLDHFRVDSIRVTEDYLETDEVRLPFGGSTKFLSIPSPTVRNTCTVKNLLLVFQDMLVHTSMPKSLLFLIDRIRGRELMSAYGKALAERAVRGWNYFLEGDVKKGIRTMSGAGYGFTPSGDDFIAGIAAGLYVIRRFFDRDVSEAIGIILQKSESENILSSVFITLAAKGHFVERIKDLIEAIVEGNVEKLSIHLGRVMEMGRTSGADFCSGLLCAFKMNEIID